MHLETTDYALCAIFRKSGPYLLYQEYCESGWCSAERRLPCAQYSVTCMHEQQADEKDLRIDIKILRGCKEADKPDKLCSERRRGLVPKHAITMQGNVWKCTTCGSPHALQPYSLLLLQCWSEIKLCRRLSSLLLQGIPEPLSSWCCTQPLESARKQAIKAVGAHQHGSATGRHAHALHSSTCRLRVWKELIHYTPGTCITC